MRKVCKWTGIIVAAIIIGVVLAILVCVASFGPIGVMAVMSLLAAVSTAYNVNYWLKCRIGDIKDQKWYEKVFIFIGKAFFCLIAAAIGAVIGALVTWLFMYLLFGYVIIPILDLIY